MNKAELKNFNKDVAIYALPNEVSVGRKQLPIVLKNFTPMKSKSLGYRTKVIGYLEGASVPEYNLSEVNAAEDVDGYIAGAILKKSFLMFERGWHLSGNNPKTVEYIKERFLQLGLAQNKPMDLFLREIGGDLVRYSNAFIYLARGKDNTGGRIRTVRTSGGTKELKPITGMFRIAPETIRMVTDDSGNVKKYFQEMPDGRIVKFNKDDVVHLYHNRRAGFNFAAPRLRAAIEDLRSLRRLEEYVELLSEQHLFPLIVIYVGTEDHPADVLPDGTPEVDLWASKINNMETSGGVVLPHRVKIEPVKFDKILPIHEYLHYFRNRVFSSLGMSAVDFGEADTSNRATAETVSNQLIKEVKDYQMHLKFFMEFEIIQQLLLEKFSDNVLLEKNTVKFNFEEIDIESFIKYENHNSLMYVQHLITEDEARGRTKMPSITPEQRSKMYLEVVEKTKTQMELDAALKETAATAQSKSRQQPSNQHGKSTGPTKAKSSMSASEFKDLNDILNNFTLKNKNLFHFDLNNWIFLLDKDFCSLQFCNEFIKKVSTDLQDIENNGFNDSEAREYIKLKIEAYLNEIY